jgi:hypothetical protein
LESCGLAGTGSATDAYHSVTRLKNEFDGMLLLGAQKVGNHKRSIIAERIRATDSTIHGGNHVSLALQAGCCCYLAAGA